MTRRTPSADGRPPLDPELSRALAALDLRTPILAAATPEKIAAFREAVTPSAEETGRLLRKAGVVRQDVIVPGYRDDDIVVTVLAREASASSPRPAFYYLHGGGMVAGTRWMALPHVLPWIIEHDAVAVAIEYRLAPEFPDPYPVEDCYAGLVWAADNATALGIDPDRILIAGASAGGGLAAGTALLARDRHGPALLGQVLIYPMLDDRVIAPSEGRSDDISAWDRASNTTAWGALLGSRSGTDDVSPYAAPARAKDLTGLPPAFIDCGSAEIFRDEDVAYALALWRFGVHAELHVWPGGFHAFDTAAPHTALAQRMVATRDDWIRRMLAPASRP